MWPFSRLSPRTRNLLAAFAIAARLVFSFQSANAESGEARAKWQYAQLAKAGYEKSGTKEDADILRKALEMLIAQLKKDVQKLPEGSEERKKMEQEIVNLEIKLKSLSGIKAGTVKFPKEVTVAVQAAAHQIAEGTYDFSRPLVVEVNKKTVILLTPDEIKKIARSTYAIKDKSQRKQAIELMMITEISKKEEVRQLSE